MSKQTFSRMLLITKTLGIFLTAAFLVTPESFAVDSKPPEEVMQLTDYRGINAGNPEEKYRHRIFRAYLPNRLINKIYKTSAYSSYENPTGIFFEAGEQAVFTVSGSAGEAELELIVRDFGEGGSRDSYPLRIGDNKLSIKNKGLAYLQYRAENPQDAPPIEVDIQGGKINGVFTAGDSVETWHSLLKNAVCNIIDLLGYRCQLTYDVTSLRKYCPDQGSELLALYDEIIRLEQVDVMGWGTKDVHPGNHIHGRVQYSGFMHADQQGAAFHVNTMGSLANPVRLRQNAWGVAHEFGHVNQTRPGMRWVGTSEITNNICSAWVNFKLFPQQMRLEHEVTENIDQERMRGGRFDCYVNSAVVKHQLWQFQSGPDSGLFAPLRGNSGDHFVGCAPFWQLMLYCTAARGNKDFYPDIFHNVRHTDESAMTNGELRVLFLKRAADAAKLNLAEFFLCTGMAAPVDRVIDDYGEASLTVTEEMLQEALDYMARYPKPDSSVIYYITANSIDIFKHKLPISISPDAPKIILPVSRVDIPGSAWKNAVAFEAYSGKKLVRVSLLGLNHTDNTTTTVICPPETDSIKAVQWDGKRVTIAKLSSDQTVRAEWKKLVKISKIRKDIQEGNDAQLKKDLAKIRFNVNEPVSDRGDTLLVEAIRQQNPRVVETLLNAGANPNARCANGKVILHLAAGFNNPEAIKLLIRHGADVMARSGNGALPIHDAVWAKSLDALQALLPHYARHNFNPEGGINGFPVAMAIGRNNEDILKLFINAGMNVNDSRFAKDPLLIQAVKKNNEQMVRMLLVAGARKEAVDASGKKAADYASGSIALLLR